MTLRPLHRRHRRQLAASTVIEHALHDLKQPVNLVRVLAQEVELDVRRSRLNTDDLSESMREIARTVDELTAMLHRLRSFYRLDELREEAAQNDHAADVRGALTRVLDDLRVVWTGVTFPSIDAMELAPVAIDDEDLEQALWELLDNAARAAHEGGTRVTLEASATDEHLLLSIEDDGPGIPADLAPRIFDPFVTTRDGASGLGLTIAREALNRYGGSIELGKSPSGTRVCLRLPLAPGPRRASPHDDEALASLEL